MNYVFVAEELSLRGRVAARLLPQGLYAGASAECIRAEIRLTVQLHRPTDTAHTDNAQPGVGK